jgi:hypothetical protein
VAGHFARQRETPAQRAARVLDEEIASVRAEAVQAEAAGNTEAAGVLRRGVDKLIQRRREMPITDVDLNPIQTTRQAFTARAGEISREIAALGVDDGRDRVWKSRERKRLLDALDAARRQATEEITTHARKAARQLERELARETRDATAATMDLGMTLRADQLARTASGRSQAEHMLLPEAKRLAELGDVRGALAHARAAATHHALGADALVARLEREHLLLQPGKREVLELQAQLRTALDEFDAAAAGEAVAAMTVASQAATAAGDLDEAQAIASSTIPHSIHAKMTAFVNAQAQAAEAEGAASDA